MNVADDITVVLRGKLEVDF